MGDIISNISDIIQPDSVSLRELTIEKMTKLYMRETIRTLEETEVDKIWTDLLPLFIVVGILIIAGILLLCEKIRETLIEKDEISVTDGPPSYDDLSINHGQIDGEEVRTPPPPYRNIEPPSYEFINRAFELDEAPPPPYVVETHTTFVN